MSILPQTATQTSITSAHIETQQVARHRRKPKASLSTLVRRALTNRYCYDQVIITREGIVKCQIVVRDRHGPVVKTYNFGNLSQWYYSRTDAGCVVVGYQHSPELHGTTIFKFEPNV